MNKVSFGGLFFCAKMKKKVAIQGIPGAFHERAARKHFGNEIDVISCRTFRQLCEELQAGKVDMAVMAIENTIAGSLLPNYALLREFGFSVVGEVYLNIQLSLMVKPGIRLQDIRVVESHPIALQQCTEYLAENTQAELREAFDTAGAAEELSASGRVDTAVIAAEACAELYGLEVLASRIETNKLNFTRFLILSRTKDEREADKVSLSFTLEHKTGSLAKVLGMLDQKRMNLTKIQSLPIIGKPYEYRFHLDMEWKNDQDINQALAELENLTENLIIHGKYRRSTFELNK